jgi:hypothetical protein
MERGTPMKIRSINICTCKEEQGRLLQISTTTAGMPERRGSEGKDASTHRHLHVGSRPKPRHLIRIILGILYCNANSIRLIKGQDE